MIEPTAKNLTCPQCVSKAVLKDSACIYGRSYGLVYICPRFPECQCFVGIHEGTLKPKGTLANKETREARKRAHAAFDALWRGLEGRPAKLRRKTAYTWLAKHFKEKEVHIGWADVARCKAIEQWAASKLVELGRPNVSNAIPSMR